MTSLDYPPGPHSILPNKLFRQFMRDPIKTLTDIPNTYGIFVILNSEDSISTY